MFIAYIMANKHKTFDHPFLRDPVLTSEWNVLGTKLPFSYFSIFKN